MEGIDSRGMDRVVVKEADKRVESDSNRSCELSPCRLCMGVFK